MMRFAPAAALVLATLAAAPVSAQTVPDYDAALAAVPAAPPPAVAQACLPLQNYVFTAMAPGDRKGPWLTSLLPFTLFASDAAAGARRDCGTVRETAVIAFNKNSAEEIVTPPMLEDASQTRPLEPVPGPLPGYDTPRRSQSRIR